MAVPRSFLIRLAFGVVSLAAISCPVFVDTASAATPNVLNYQGRLKESGQPVTGGRAVEIKLCDALAAGTCVTTGSQGVSVANGLFRTTFTVPGSVDLASGDWYVELVIGGVTYSPRERLTSVPYALYAATAVFAASAQDATKVAKSGDAMTGPLTMRGSTLTVQGNEFSVGGSTFVVKGGRVGIGTTNPLQALTVNGTIESLGGGIKFPDGTTQTTAATASSSVSGSGTANYLSKFTGASVLGNSSIVDNGNVGIGTTGPAAKLDVGGNAQFGSGATKSTFTAAGALNLASALTVANGGTGATTAGGAQTNLGVPSTAGSGASGTWPISITGTSAGAPPTGAAGGNLGGTYPNPSIASLPAISGALLTSLTAANIAAGTAGISISGNAATATNATNHIADVTGAVHGATNLNTANMIVRRDAFGNFTAGTITAALSGNATTASGAPPTGAAGGDLSGTYPSPTLNLGLAHTWTGAQTFNGVNNFPGSGIWNASGNVGIGTSNPSSKLSVAGNVNSPLVDILNNSNLAGAMGLQVTGSGLQGAITTYNLKDHSDAKGLIAQAFGLGTGVYGYANGLGKGIHGYSTSGVGVLGVTGGGASPAIEADSAGGLNTNYGLKVVGYATVSGNLTKGGGTFLIDHPLDPANKVLRHSFVESPDMKNIYDGIATLDKNGRAAIALPSYFAALNVDFRYQLTPIGKYVPAYVMSEIAENRFTIASANGSNDAGAKISWQVSGIRNDAYARRNPIIVEESKDANNQFKPGVYLHPEAIIPAE